MKKLLASFGLLAAIVLASGAARADTFTLDGAPVISFSSNPSIKLFSVQMDAPDSLTYLTDAMLDAEIPILTFDEFVVVNGTPTLADEINFIGVFVTSFQFLSGSDPLVSDVTFKYTDFKITEG